MCPPKFHFFHIVFYHFPNFNRKANIKLFLVAANDGNSHDLVFISAMMGTVLILINC